MMYRHGTRLLLLGQRRHHPVPRTLHQRTLEAKMTGRPVQEIQIPMPWGYVAGKWWGDTSVQPVLGFHGWEDNAATFDNLAPLLNLPSFLAVDIMGHGNSSHFPTFGAPKFPDAVLLIRRIVQHFKWKKISIIGHSFGSAMGFLYSSFYPDEVDKYVSIDCARTLMIPGQATFAENIRKTLDRTLDIEKRMANDPPSYTYEDLLERVYTGSGKSPTKESCAVLLQRGMKKSPQTEGHYHLSRDPRVKPSWLGTLTEDYLLACAPRIKCQVLSIRGKQGFLRAGKPEEVYLHTLRLMQRCEHHDVDGTHHLHLNSPEAVAALVNKFFAVHSSL